ncbi:tRNA pseudouridine(55) synthase TruB [Planctomycetota bacterium]
MSKKSTARLPDPAGILLIDKPVGLTSHDVVDRVRKAFGYRKVGHAGSLDPLATGVLVLLVGKATRAQDRFLNDDKVYRGTVRLGSATTTQDAGGEVTERHEGPLGVSRERLQEVMQGFVGEIDQTPPMVSAVKHKGKPLYKYARKGVEIERKPRKIKIYELKLLGFDGETIELEVACSKGTYVRTLAHDIGQKLGCHGHLSSLRRVRSGPFAEEDLHTLEKVLGSRREEVLYMLRLVSEVSG